MVGRSPVIFLHCNVAPCSCMRSLSKMEVESESARALLVSLSCLSGLRVLK